VQHRDPARWDTGKQLLHAVRRLSHMSRRATGSWASSVCLMKGSRRSHVVVNVLSAPANQRKASPDWRKEHLSRTGSTLNLKPLHLDLYNLAVFYHRQLE
jgi:hypothetical protein